MPRDSVDPRIRAGCPPYVSGEGGAPKPVAFLDRDGVVNREFGFVHRVEDFQWCDGAIDAIRYLNAQDYKVIVVTNQSGIGRGLYTLDDFLMLSRWMLEEADRLGATISALYYCPHHPDDLCPARKPGTGMLEAAECDFGVDRERSILIGDRGTDIEAATAFGIKGKLYKHGNLLAFAQEALSSLGPIR